MPYALRLAALRKSLRGVDALLVTRLLNVRYLTGFRGSAGSVLVSRDFAFFITDFRYKEQSRDEVAPCYEIVIGAKGNASALARLIKQRGVRRLGFEGSATFDFYNSIKGKAREVTCVSGAVEKLRAVKDEGELSLIREAVRRAEAAFVDVRTHIRAGVAERSIALRLEERLKRHGCVKLPFDIIVASGPNSSRPHAGVSERRLSPGDLVTIDWGGEAGGYFSDMTRAFLLKGPGASKKMEIHAHVLRANRLGIEAVAAGRGTAHVDKAARDSIKKAGYAEYFGHGLGHGVGLEVHELPSLSPRRSTRLRAGMVVTIEPGIYVPGVGGVRIEDMVVVGERGVEVLTSLDKSLEII